MLEHVLPVARPVAEPAEDLDDLLVEVAAVRLEDRLLAGAHAAGLPAAVHGVASMVALIFNESPFSNYRSLPLRRVEAERIYFLHRWLLNHGVQIIPHGMMLLSTPMTEADIDEMVEASAAGMQERAMRTLEHFPNLVTMFFTRAREKGDAPFLWRKGGGAWRSISWAQAAQQVASLSAGLKATGLQMVHVPYRGVAPATTDLLGGRIQVLFDTLPAAIQNIRAGKIRGLAVTSKKRSDALPDVPAMNEFVPGYEAESFHGISAPKGAPREIVAKLNREINAALADPKLKAQLAELGARVFTGTPEDYGKIIRSEMDKWARIIRNAGIRAE